MGTTLRRLQSCCHGEPTRASPACPCPPPAGRGGRYRSWGHLLCNFLLQTLSKTSLFVCFQPVVLAGEFSNQNSTEGLFVCNPVHFGQGYTNLLLYSIIWICDSFGSLAVLLQANNGFKLTILVPIEKQKVKVKQLQNRESAFKSLVPYVCHVLCLLPGPHPALLGSLLWGQP